MKTFLNLPRQLSEVNFRHARIRGEDDPVGLNPINARLLVYLTGGRFKLLGSSADLVSNRFLGREVAAAQKRGAIDIVAQLFFGDVEVRRAVSDVKRAVVLGEHAHGCARNNGQDSRGAL